MRRTTNLQENELFDCPHAPRLRVTKTGCSRMYLLANKKAQPAQNLDLCAYQYCRECPTGKLNYGSLPADMRKIQNNPPSKICLLYQAFPKKCYSKEKEGIFFRHMNQIDFQWDRKKFCCGRCGIEYNKLKQNGWIERSY